MLLRIILLIIFAVIVVVGIIAFARSKGQHRELAQERASRQRAETELQQASATIRSVEADLRNIAHGEVGSPELTALAALDTISNHYSQKDVSL